METVETKSNEGQSNPCQNCGEHERWGEKCPAIRGLGFAALVREGNYILEACSLPLERRTERLEDISKKIDRIVTRNIVAATLLAHRRIDGSNLPLKKIKHI